ncbi:pre-mRNA-splicing factor CWC22-like, partial [Trifolium medium]|nr:pre-mRNA-splicing factor CWC22-like [Trifolium medium]
MIWGRHPIHGDQGILPLPLHRPLHTGDTVGLCPGLYQGPYPEAVRGRIPHRSTSRDAENPGNNLYVTGLSPRITKRELEKHFAAEGKVVDVHLVVDPWTRESRGFGFVTMASLEEADRCVKYLNRSVLEGRVIMVEK